MIARADALKLVEPYLEEMKKREYSSLADRARSNSVEMKRIENHGGQALDVEAQFFWDNKPGGAVRVILAIDPADRPS